MTLDETVAVFELAVGGCAAGHAPANLKAALEAWHVALAPLPYEPVRRAVAKHVAESRWMPAPADIRQAAIEFVLDLPDPILAWEIADAHLRNGRGTPFAGPEAIRRAIRLIGGWHVIRESEHQALLRKEFVETAYPAVVRDIHAKTDVAQAWEERLAAALPAAPLGPAALHGGVP